MTRWFAELLGETAELAEWQRNFPSGGEPNVGEHEVPDGVRGSKIIAGIADHQFEMLEGAREVYELAKTLFDQMKGWIIVNNRWAAQADSVMLGAIYGRNDTSDYRGHHFMKCEGSALAVRGHGVGKVIRNGDAVRRPLLKPTDGQITLGGNHQGTKEALGHFGRMEREDWVTIYMAYEALGKSEGLTGRGITRKDVTRFVQTSSIFRHHSPMPQDYSPMSFEEARGLLAKAIRAEDQ